MCQIRKKLLLFDYMIGKFVEWDTGRLLEESSAELKNNSLEKLTGVRLMKLLYFVCLQSAVNVYDNIRNNVAMAYPNHLFKVYDSYVAMPKGPVEDDMYSNRSILFRFRFRDNRLYWDNDYSDIIDSNYTVNREDKELYGQPANRATALDHLLTNAFMTEQGVDPRLDHYRNQIDQAVKYLQMLTLRNKFPFDDKEELVRLSHNLVLWRYYFECEDKRYKLTENEIALEAEAFRSKADAID